MGGGDEFNVRNLGVCRAVVDPRGATELQQQRLHHSISDGMEAMPVPEAGRGKGHGEGGRNSDPTMPKATASAEPRCAALPVPGFIPQRNVLAGACGAEQQGRFAGDLS